MSRARVLLAVFLLLVGLTYGSLINGQAIGETSPSQVPTDLNLSGVWAMVQITSEIASIPIVGNRTRTTTTHLRLIMEQREDTLSVLEINCGTNIDDGTMMVNTTIPDAFLRSLGVTERAARLEIVSEMDPSTGNPSPERRIVFPWTTQVLGARLEDPENEALPMDAADPRVFDQDNDGHPGMTVQVEIMGLIGGEVYVVQRNRNRLMGTVVSRGFIRGTIEWETEQVILGASSPFLASGGQGSPDPDPERNFFLARRIDPMLDCTDIQQMDFLLLGD
jgi:hypothetical protein